MSSKPVVVIPRCGTCNGRFKPKEKVNCVECNKKIHYDCAVYEYDDSNDFMLCLDCYKNSKIEKALVRDGIICKVEGDDLCRAYIGKSFLLNCNGKIKIHDECDNDLDIESIEDCAYGYCREDLYNRGKLAGWEKKYICDRCKKDLEYLEELDKLKKKYDVL